MDGKVELVGENIYFLEPKDIDIENKSLKNVNGVPTIVLVFADWCGHCTHFKSVFAEVANALSKKVRFAVAMENSTLPIHKSNIEACKVLMGMFKIQGFPTVLMFDKNGKFVDTYKNKRDTESLKSTATSLLQI